MFDNDTFESPTDQLLDIIGTAHVEINIIETQLIQLALCFADLNPAPDPPPGGGRFTVLGGEGCPALPESCIVEFGAALDLRYEDASAYLGEALALRHRFPKTFARVLTGVIDARWGRQLAQSCLSLTLPAAAIVDEELPLLVDDLDPRELNMIIISARVRAGRETPPR